ncbi:MAG: histidine ammonia-lyase [Planctomycetota bacterium]|nr:histidine ammonia-lyase [Planctomycetota bacterium]
MARASGQGLIQLSHWLPLAASAIPGPPGAFIGTLEPPGCGEASRPVILLLVRGPGEKPLTLDGSPLSIADIDAVAQCDLLVALDDKAMVRIQAARDLVDNLAGGPDPVYGINTGFGSLSRHRVKAEEVSEIQLNLLRSHAAGVGDPLPREIVRAMTLLLAASLTRGRSGVRPMVIQQLIDMLNADVVPVVPSRGSVGASGDLAPLAHLTLVLVGEGHARIGAEETVLSGAEALQSAGLSPIELQAKEGLALINGTHMMAAFAALSLRSVDRVLESAVFAASMAIDACLGSATPLDPRIHEARCQPGQVAIAQQMRSLLEGSKITPSHADDDPRVQDPYCLRATPQVLGAAKDAVTYARSVVERELGAVTDNPLVFEGGDILSGANFHGMPLAIAMDTLCIALCHVAGIAERRIFWVLSGHDSHNPVPSCLSPSPGLHSGLMIAQYTAAACCNEMQTLATPASVANISTSAGIEDYNSMGATSAHQLAASLRLCRDVIAIELLIMSEGLEHQRPLKSGAGVETIHERIRREVPPLTGDRPPGPDIETVAAMIQRGDLASLV